MRSKIFVAKFKKNGTSLQSDHPVSIFETTFPKEKNPRILLSIGGACCLALILMALMLFIIPPEAWENSTSGSQTRLLQPRQDRCSVLVSNDNRKCIVQCSRIGTDTPEQPGHVAAKFILDKLEIYQDLCSSWHLEISLSLFPGHELSVDWFSVDGEEGLPAISALRLEDCGALSRLQPGALAASPALGANLRDLTLTRNIRLSQLLAGSTDGLTGLINFYWRENGVLQWADAEALRPFRSTLQVLEVKGGFANATVMSQLVGSCQNGQLPALQILDVSASASPGLEQLGRRQLLALSGVQALYLFKSGITHLEDETVFNPVAPTVKLLNLQNNQLRTMREGTLDSIIAFSKGTKLSLQGNNWHCDCHLQWLQDVLINKTGDIQLESSDKPKCFSPDEQNGKLLVEANMSETCGEPIRPIEPLEVTCPISSTIRPPDATTTGPGIETTSLQPPLEHVECTQYVPSSIASTRTRWKRDTVPLPTRLPGFDVQEYDNNENTATVHVNTGVLDSYKKSKNLIWSNSKQVIGCFSNVAGMIKISNLNRNTSYVFCMLDDDKSETSPNHCVPLTTKLDWPSRTWLNNDDKTIVITSVAFAILLCLIIGASCVIIAFWRNPTLLALNKRVVKVQTSRHDAIVMPPEDCINNNNNPNNNDDDTESMRSDPSYVSIAHASKISLFAFRFRDWLRRLSNDELTEGTSDDYKYEGPRTGVRPSEVGEVPPLTISSPTRESPYVISGDSHL